MARITGLSTADVRGRRERGEVNTLPNDTGRSLWRILQANLFTLFNAIVGGSFLLLLVLGYWQDALFGFFVIANVAIGVAQEFRAKVTLSRLAVLNAPRARVLRRASDDGADESSDGEVEEVAIADVVQVTAYVCRGKDTLVPRSCIEAVLQPYLDAVSDAISRRAVSRNWRRTAGGNRHSRRASQAKRRHDE